MVREKQLKDVVIVLFGNLFRLFTGIVTGFIIPALLGIVNYGLYKVFALYLTYMALSHLGFADGIYLKYGGYSIHDLDKSKFRGFTKIFFIIQTIILLLGISIAVLFINGDTQIILILVFLNVFPVNIINYFQLLSQATSKFKEYSLITIINAGLSLLAILFLYLFHVHDYRVYILTIFIGNILIMLWYIFKYKKFIFGKSLRIKQLNRDIRSIFVTGVPLLLSNLIVSFIMAIDKQMVQIFFELDDFSIYSFSYSILSIITVVISSISIVLFPFLKKMEKSITIKLYPEINAIIISLAILGLFSYFPILYIIKMFLGTYIGSIKYMRILMPTLLFTSSISAIKHNFYKINDLNHIYLFHSILVLFITIGLNLLSYYVFRSIDSIAYSMIVSCAIWSLSMDIYLYRKFRIKWLSSYLLIAIGYMLFYSLTSFDNILIAGIVYLFLSVLLLIVFNRKRIHRYFLKKDSNLL